MHADHARLGRVSQLVARHVVTMAHAFHEQVEVESFSHVVNLSGERRPFCSQHPRLVWATTFHRVHFLGLLLIVLSRGEAPQAPVAHRQRQHAAGGSLETLTRHRRTLKACPSSGLVRVRSSHPVPRVGPHAVPQGDAWLVGGGGNPAVMRAHRQPPLAVHL
nr:MAG TPA: hypothetical protein [Caudoviricetes sp.]